MRPHDEAAKERIKAWFLERYEDPTERTPYISAEGGWQWIWGGPFDAGEILFERFRGLVSEPIIEVAVKELERDTFEWTHTAAYSDKEMQGE